MFKKSEKFIIFFLFISLLFLNLLILPDKIFAQRALELRYPEIQGFRPETVASPLPDYVKYIFNFFIALVGLIGFAALVVAGIRYLTSAGNVEKLKRAKKQIIAAFLGILLLLFSYLILTTINPQLVVFRQLAITPAPEVPPLPDITVSSESITDPLERIRQFAETVKQTADAVDAAARLIEHLTDDCDCRETEAACACTGDDGGGGGGGFDGGGGGGGIGF